MAVQHKSQVDASYPKYQKLDRRKLRWCGLLSNGSTIRKWLFLKVRSVGIDVECYKNDYLQQGSKGEAPKTVEGRQPIQRGSSKVCENRGSFNGHTALDGTGISLLGTRKPEILVLMKGFHPPKTLWKVSTHHVNFLKSVVFKTCICVYIHKTSL